MTKQKKTKISKKTMKESEFKKKKKKLILLLKYLL